MINNSDSIKTGNRISALDLLRGIAVILMVQQHTGYWFWNAGTGMSSLLKEYPVMVTINGLGGLAAPIFILLAGTGTALSYASDKSGRMIFKRGIMLVICGYILSILTPAWFAPWSWYVLHLIGFGMCISLLLRRTDTRLLLFIVFFIMISAVILLSAFDMPRSFSNKFMRGSSGIAGVFRLAMFSGNFPVFPWMALFITGLISGRWIYSGKYSNLIKIAAAFLFIALMLFFVKQGNFSLLNNGFGRRLLTINLYMYPAYPMQFLTLTAVSMFSVYGLLIAGTRFSISADNIVVLLGRVSLSIFIVHIVTIRNFMVLSGLWQTFSLPVTVMLQISVIGLIMLLVYFWKKSGFSYGLEWLMRKVS